MLISVSFICGCVATGPVSPFYRYETKGKVLISPPYLQVLLTEYNNVNSALIKVNSPYKIYSYQSERNNKFLSHPQLSNQSAMTEPVMVFYSRGKINIGKPVGLWNDDIIIVPSGENSLIQVGKRNYRGYLRIKGLPDNKISLVNIIDLESYLVGVVSSEMDENWPQESLEAQAITARSFAFYRIKQSNLAGNQTRIFDYDLTDDVFSQVYRGEECTGPKTRQAVEKTRGIIIVYDSAIFNCIFHSTCGGHTEPINMVFGGPDAIPSLKGISCGFCNQAKYFQWQAGYSQEEIIKMLNLKNIQAIDDILITTTGPGGHGTEITLKISGSSDIIMQANRFRLALGPNKLRSTNFRITRRDNVFQFTGRGWGHAVGMCQEGTRGMSHQNFRPLQILEHYYPESKIVKIY